MIWFLCTAGGILLSALLLALGPFLLVWLVALARALADGDDPLDEERSERERERRG